MLNYPATSNRPFEELTNGTQSRAFEYDAAGNTTRGLPAGQAYTLEYNNRGRPQALKQNGNPFASYLYNGLDQLASRTVSQPSPATTHYIYDLDGRLIAEATGASAASAVLTREYIWLEGMPIAVIDGVNTASPVTYYVHTDHLTRPIRMTDSNRVTVWSASWLPYGGVNGAITGTATQNLRFPGQYFLIEQGLAYNWHRFYDPTTARYTQPDPLSFPNGPSRYAYAMNSPLMYTDWDGLDAAAAHKWAIDHVFNTDYQYWDPSDLAGGLRGKWFSGRFSNKCNKFVYDALKAGGNAPNLVNGHAPTVQEWKDGKVKNYSPLPKGQMPIPGDVIVDGGHMGLYSPIHGPRSPGTISAAAINADHMVVQNNWGFRDGQTPIIYRCDCDSANGRER